MDIITSARDEVDYSPAGSPRSYRLAPLNFRERMAFRAHLTREAGEYPSDAAMYLAMRGAVREVEKLGQLDNAAELIAIIDAAEVAAPEDMDIKAQCLALETKLSIVPAYSEMLIARQRYLMIQPWLAARHALRGWSGEGLPEFERHGSTVPESLMDVLADLGELADVGRRANALMQPGRAVAGNSASPSPSPAIAMHAVGETRRKTGRNGSSRAKSGT